MFGPANICVTPPLVANEALVALKAYEALLLFKEYDALVELLE